MSQVAFRDGVLNRIPVPVEGPGRITLEVSIPIVDIQGYWAPLMQTPETKLHWEISFLVAAQQGFPAIVFFNSRHETRALVAISNLVDDTRVTARLNQERCTYDVTIETAATADTLAYELTVDCRRRPWVESLAEWRGTLALPAPPAVPAGAWEPVFCTWYAVHAAVTEEWVERNAAAAADLGFGTLIIDDGWCFEVMKRVSPQTIGTWYDNIGSWRVAPVKFPHFRRHVERIHQLGMRYMLWVAPFLVGTRRIADGTFAESALLPTPVVEGYRLLDVSQEAAAAPVLERMAALLRDYPIDGLKVDFLDIIKPDLEHPRARHVLDFTRRLAAALRGIRPEALIEFRQNYANSTMLPYATQFRSGDVPFDFIENFHQMAQMHATIGGGVPIHADPMYWSPGEDPANISRHFIASLIGVPMLSMDVTRFTDTEREITSFWIGFYRRNLPSYQQGRWRIVYHGKMATHAILEATGRPRIAVIQDAARAPEALARMDQGDFLLNLSQEELAVPAELLFAPQRLQGVPPAAGIIPAGACARLA